MTLCPSCRRPHTIRRGEIGAVATTICDHCYWERFSGQPGEIQYFGAAPEFWAQIEAECAGV